MSNDSQESFAVAFNKESSDDGDECRYDQLFDLFENQFISYEGKVRVWTLLQNLPTCEKNKSQVTSWLESLLEGSADT